MHSASQSDDVLQFLNSLKVPSIPYPCQPCLIREYSGCGIALQSRPDSIQPGTKISEQKRRSFDIDDTRSENEGASASTVENALSSSRRVTAPDLRMRKAAGERIVVVTAYDYPSARLAERAGIDVVLVGDSLGKVVLGYKNVIPVTLEEMLHHVRAVTRGIKRALVIADMPFGSYQASVEDAMRGAVELLRAGAHAVKIEGGESIGETVRRLTEAGIPVMGHLGLTPQSVNRFGGHRVQGTEQKAAERMLVDARLLETAGAFGIVLETIPANLAGQISAAIAIPTIGIGAGAGCDGQVQVWHDLLGYTDGRTLKHVKRYAEVGSLIEAALREYADEVRKGSFPTKEQSQ